MSELKVNKISPRSGTDVTLGDSGDTFTIPAGATLTNNGSASGFASIAWQSAIKTASFTAVAGEGYWVNTTSGAITITLPASASVGDEIEFTDYARTWGTNSITLALNGLKYQGGTVDAIYDISGQSVRIVYSGATNGWIPTSDDAVSDETITSYSVEMLIVAGGGGGGQDDGGGGGAGGYRTSTQDFDIGTTYNVTVGAGGAGSGGPSSSGAVGSDSSISGTGLTTITSSGGGGGSSGGGQNASDGGSGGGGGGTTMPSPGGSGNTPSTSPSQGNDGGAGSNPTNRGGGGGGGAGEAGNTDGQSYGGDGTSNSITGSAVFYAGGGGGSTRVDGTQRPGGDGGGGAGGTDTPHTDASDATANTGGGGGGGSGSGPDQTGGAGGSGVVILKMPTTNYTGTTTGSPTVSTDGTDTILTYTGNGSYTA